MHGSHEIFCGIPGVSECPYGQRWGLLAKSGTGIRDHALSCQFQSAISSLLAPFRRSARRHERPGGPP